ncbi:competence protein ComK [Salibacterium qingdaonense]|uniref:Competence protein ComK n=1 Tax=Salibacterium qingdaonense TaxID=266892 RepID=A0A1I4KZZ4_9BACI|nr:competence protein ComK [Salibacterium qingdaonense]SFL84310.1 competence protein ComK [Salibacterium qingdaonense]
MEHMLEFRAVYEVTKSTVGIVSMLDGEVKTRVYETDGSTIFTAQPAESIMEEACLEGGSSMAGRLTYVRRKLGFKYRRPVPVNEKEGLYAFPLHGSPGNQDSWFFYSHILRVEVDKYDQRTYLVFRNGQRAEVNASYYHAQQQILKTSRCITMIKGKEEQVH